MQTLALAQVDQRPDFGHVHRRGYLDGHVMAMFQRLACNQVMVEPVGRDIYQVDVVAAAQVLIPVFAIIDVGGGHRRPAQDFLTGLGTVALVVTQGLHLDAGNMRPTLYRIRATHSQTDKRHPNDRNLLHCKPQC